jgi:hypothetical protein
MRRFEHETSEEIADLYWERVGQDWGPDAVFIAAASEAAVEELAQRMDVAYELCVSERLAQLLPGIDSYLSLCVSSPAARGYGLERLNRFLMFSSAKADREAGLYRYDVWGRPEYRFVDEAGTFHAVDRALGVYAELRRMGRNEIRYAPDAVNGTLIVPFRAQLPALHARCAVLCSGLMPRLDRWQWHYVNVPLDTARKIADSLGQQLRQE